MKKLIIGLCSTGISVLSTICLAAEPSLPPAMSIVDETLIAEVRGWANSNVVYLTLADRNVKNLSLDEAKIDALDKQWRAERKTSDPPLITAVLSSPLSG